MTFKSNRIGFLYLVESNYNKKQYHLLFQIIIDKVTIIFRLNGSRMASYFQLVTDLELSMTLELLSWTFFTVMLKILVLMSAEQPTSWALILLKAL